MLKFSEPNELYNILPGKEVDCEYAKEVLDSFSALNDGETSALASYTNGCIAVRVFDGGIYRFVCPIPISFEYDLKAALLNVRDYALREMLCPEFTDVCKDDLDVFTATFKMPRAEAYPDDDELFYVILESELDLLGEVPMLSFGRITLGEIKEGDKDRYAALALDRELNRFWGYDVRLDNPNADADYLLGVVKRERELGIALSLGVFLDGELIGEAVLYAFDYAGGASFAVRLLREYHGRGLGGEAFLALTELAKSIGLDYIRTEVAEENTASVAVCKKYFDTGRTFDGKIEFKKEF